MPERITSLNQLDEYERKTILRAAANTDLPPVSRTDFSCCVSRS